MYNELKDNLKLLFAETNRLSKTDINGQPVRGKFNLYGVKVILSIFSIGIILLKGTGFSSDFLAFITSYLSILIGLFITALIFSFDKFYDNKDGEDLKKIENNVKLRIWDVQAYNYTKKFAFMTSQTIVISVFVLGIVACEYLFNTVSKINIWNYQFVTLENIELSSVAQLAKNILVLSFRFLTLYWLFTIMINTLYIVSGMVDYMIKKHNRKVNN